MLAAEAFSRGLQALVSHKKIDTFSIPLCCLPVSHLTFQDDVVIFTKARKQSLKGLAEFLDFYQAVSGQRINKSKSFFIASWKCGLQKIMMIERMLGINLSHCLSSTWVV